MASYRLKESCQNLQERVRAHFLTDRPVLHVHFSPWLDPINILMLVEFMAVSGSRMTSWRRLGGRISQD